MVSKSKFYTALFILVLFFQLYLPSFKWNLFFQIGVLLLYFCYEKIAFEKSFLKKMAPVLLLFGFGFIGTVYHRYPIYGIIKDVFHFLKPIVGLLIGFLFFKKINNFNLFVKTIVYCGLASAIIHFLVLIFMGNIFSGSVDTIREFGKDNFLELFALFFLLFYNHFQNAPLLESRIRTRVIALILLLSNVIYFSRTMIAVAIILALSVYGYTVLTKKTIRFLGVLIISIGLFYGYLFSIKIERNKPGIDSFLFKVKIAPAELFKTKIDRNNHKDLWDHWRGYEAKRAYALMEENPSSFVVGTGFGSLVNLKFKAPLTGEKEGIKYISELHNGYMYVFYKTGGIGVIILLLFFGTLYLSLYTIQKNKKMISVFISGIGLVYLFTTLTITGIYNGRDVIIFILGGLLYFERNLDFTNETEA